MASHIVLTTFGSLGDLHPCLALALELKSRGHKVTVATCETYRTKVEAVGLLFHPVRPDLPDIEKNPEVIARVMDLTRGTEYLTKELLMPALRGGYDDLLEATRDADLLVTHPVTLAAPLVAEKRGLRWVSTALAPFSLLSVYDPPVPPIAPAMAKLYKLGPQATRGMVKSIRWLSYSWLKPVIKLRQELGLPDRGHPFFEGQHSPYGSLALFSKYLAQPQPDWPAGVKVTGFPWYDQLGSLQWNKENTGIGSGSGNAGNKSRLSPELEAFLQSGEPPIVFTLGSSAVMDAGDFYRASAEAARIVGKRAVLLAGSSENLPHTLPDGVAAFDYAPYGEIFGRAAAIVHQGGVGTTGQAMRSGKPQLIMPYSHDQPDNAARITRLGIGRSLTRSRYTAARAAAELFKLLGDSDVITRAAQIGEGVRAENGTIVACDAIEAVLNGPKRSEA